MIIGVDLQPFQTASKNRGIGRYSKNLLDNILKIDTEDKFKLFLNNTFKENVQVVQNKNAEFEKINYRTSTGPEDIVANSLIQFLKYEY